MPADSPSSPRARRPVPIARATGEGHGSEHVGVPEHDPGVDATVPRTPEEAAAHRRALASARQKRRREKVASAARRGRPASEVHKARLTLDRISAANHDLIVEHVNARAARLMKNSRQAYTRDLVDFALRLEEGMPEDPAGVRPGRTLLEATEYDVTSWLAANTRDPSIVTKDDGKWHARTAQRKRAALNSFFRWARRQKRISDNPADGAEIKHLKGPKPRRFSREQIDELIATAESQMALSEGVAHLRWRMDVAILRLLFNLALRVSDVTNLRFSQIVSERGADDRLRRVLQIVQKGAKTSDFPVSGVVAESLDSWLRVRTDLAVEIKPGHHDFVFVHPNFGKRVSVKRTWLRLRRIATIAAQSETSSWRTPGEIEKLSAHKLRHARAYFEITNGRPIQSVASILSHNSILTTQVYVTDDEEARMRALVESSNDRGTRPAPNARVARPRDE